MSKKILIIILLVLTLVAIGFIATITINRTGKTKVAISAFPDDTSITFNGQPITTGTKYLEPGTYRLEAKREGFDDYSKIVVLEETEQTVAVILIPRSEEAKQWTRENAAAQQKVQGEVEKAVYESGKIFKERNPITRHLPDRSFIFTIGYRMDQSDPSGNSIIIEIDASEGYKQAALNRIRQLGYDPTDLTINFRGYENPFSL